MSSARGSKRGGARFNATRRSLTNGGTRARVCVVVVVVSFEGSYPLVGTFFWFSQIFLLEIQTRNASLVVKLEHHAPGCALMAVKS